MYLCACVWVRVCGRIRVGMRARVSVRVSCHGHECVRALLFLPQSELFIGSQGAGEGRQTRVHTDRRTQTLITHTHARGPSRARLKARRGVIIDVGKKRPA